MNDLDRLPRTPAQFAARRKPFCLLCGRPSATVNLYFPSQRRRAAPQPGKSRVVIYSLCLSCASNFKALGKAIERKIESQLRATGRS